MRRLVETVTRAAPLDTPVVVEGPTGSGKELVAELLHTGSGRHGEFVAVNAASVPESLADSELFGVVRGAFTGAGSDRRGLIGAADGGTLFLDEAADLPLSVQTKLLRVLDSGLLRPVGGQALRRARFRLVVSVQVSPRSLVADGRWREDFYYRVAGLHIQVPALSARASDISILARHFLGEHGLTIADPDRWAELEALEWPGNVRQLRRAVERAIFDAAGAAVAVADLLEAVREETRLRAVRPAPEPAASHPSATLTDAIRDYITSVLSEVSGDTRAAARMLGLSRSQLYRKMQALGIRPRPLGAVANTRS
jgi:DNA-binding NtrC family response regulator